MDTDELFIETYNAIFITSEKFNHDLTIQFGLLADECNDDNDYLIKVKKLIKEIRTDLDFALKDIFSEEQMPTKVSFEKALIKIETQINKVLNIPIEKRKFEF